MLKAVDLLAIDSSNNSNDWVVTRGQSKSFRFLSSNISFDFHREIKGLRLIVMGRGERKTGYHIVM